ncbi:MAG TPA: hypothetical protein VEQ60_23645, partial [Longimicrobium sp.]|nr:hypothetical protein [Longimicrobium sp.]
MRIVGYAADEGFRARLEAAAARSGAELTLVQPAGGGSASNDDQFFSLLRTHPDAALLEMRRGLLERTREEAGTRGIAVLVACRDEAEARQAIREGAEEWLLSSATEEEIAARIEGACERLARSIKPRDAREAADHLRYEELLYDRFT